MKLLCPTKQNSENTMRITEAQRITDFTSSLSLQNEKIDEIELNKQTF
jgi:hypothetical protein